MKKTILSLMAIILIFIAGCISTPQQTATEDNLICIQEGEINSLCDEKRAEIQDQIRLDKGLNESKADIIAIEEDLVIINVTAIDPDGDNIQYNFSEPFNMDGEWQTYKGDAGLYITKVFATDGFDVIEKELIILIQKKNYDPVINIDDIVTFKEGEKMVLPLEITDEDEDEVVYTVGGWPFGKTYLLGYNTAGEYNVTITANDGKNKVTKTIVAIIENVNRVPEIEELDTLTVKEGNKITLSPRVTDPDGDKVTLSYSEPFNNNGEWIPKLGDEGEYDYTITAFDGMDESSKLFKIDVVPANHAPILEEIEDVVVNEGDTIKFTPIAYDPEGDEITITYSGFMSGNTYTTTYEDSGEYIVTITVADTERKSFQHVKVTILNTNRPPVFIE